MSPIDKTPFPPHLPEPNCPLLQEAPIRCSHTNFAPTYRRATSCTDEHRNISKEIHELATNFCTQ